MKKMLEAVTFKNASEIEFTSQTRSIEILTAGKDCYPPIWRAITDDLVLLVDEEFVIYIKNSKKNWGLLSEMHRCGHCRVYKTVYNMITREIISRTAFDQLGEAISRNLVTEKHLACYCQ